MSQISRPFQILLLVALVGGAAYFFVLRPHPPATGSAPAGPVAAAPATPPVATPPKAGPLPPGIAGLSRAIQHARGAAATANGQSAAAASASAAATPPAAATPSPAAGAAPASAPAAHTSASPAPAPPAPASAGGAAAPTAAGAGPAGRTASGAASTLAGPAHATGAVAHAAGAAAATPARPVPTLSPKLPVIALPAAPPANPAQAVQRELAAGKTALILFWNPQSSDDQSVRAELRRIDTQHGRVVVHIATPGQAVSYGTVTSTISVLQTPTIILLNPRAQASTLPGLVDAAAINQAVADAQTGTGVRVPHLADFSPGSDRAFYVAEANSVCRRSQHTQGSPPQPTGDGVKDAVALLRWAVAGDSAVIDRLSRLAAPAADRAFVRGMLARQRAADREVNAALASSAPVKSRALLLQAQIDADLAGSMGGQYGLTACTGA